MMASYSKDRIKTNCSPKFNSTWSIGVQISTKRLIGICTLKALNIKLTLKMLALNKPCQNETCINHCISIPDQLIYQINFKFHLKHIPTSKPNQTEHLIKRKLGKHPRALAVASVYH